MYLRRFCTKLVKNRKKTQEWRDFSLNNLGIFYHCIQNRKKVILPIGGGSGGGIGGGGGGIGGGIGGSGGGFGGASRF